MAQGAALKYLLRPNTQRSTKPASPRPASDLVPEPAALHGSELMTPDGIARPPRPQVVEQLANWDEPAAFRDEPPQQSLYLRVDVAVHAEASSEVRVNDAYTCFAFEPILILLREEAAEPPHIATVSRAEPQIDPGLSRVVVRQRRVQLLNVDLVKHEIADVADALLTQIAPEIPGPFYAALEVAPAAKPSRDIVAAT